MPRYILLCLVDTIQKQNVKDGKLSHGPSLGSFCNVLILLDYFVGTVELARTVEQTEQRGLCRAVAGDWLPTRHLPDETD